MAPSICLRSATLLFASCAALAWAAPAQAQIKQPGAHPRYSVELEPHGLLQYRDRWYTDDNGFGLGLRASIPILHDGPIPSINNSLAIGFGVDWATFDECGRFNDCNAHMFWFPVVAQWNFFFTPIVSVFGELGLSPVYRSADYDGCLRDSHCDDSDFDPIRPLFFGGGRFLFTDNIGLVVRLGIPYVSLGATFLL